jgi:cytoskeletal protein RodZ
MDDSGDSRQRLVGNNNSDYDHDNSNSDGIMNSNNRDSIMNSNNSRKNKKKTRTKNQVIFVKLLLILLGFVVISETLLAVFNKKSNLKIIISSLSSVSSSVSSLNSSSVSSSDGSIVSPSSLEPSSDSSSHSITSNSQLNCSSDSPSKLPTSLSLPLSLFPRTKKTHFEI